LLAGLATGQAIRWYPRRGAMRLVSAPPAQMMSSMRPSVARAGMTPPTTPQPGQVLRIPDQPTGQLVGEQDVGELASAGRISPFLALAGDPGRGLLLTAGVDGRLRCYSRSLQLLGERRLSGVAYQLALDEPSGLLYAAVAPEESIRLGPLGDRDLAVGDLHVYDVKNLLEGRSEPGATLLPVRTLELRGQVYTLLLSREGKHLYYLADGGRESHAGRVATDTWTRDGVLPVRGGALATLVQAPDTGLLVGLSGGGRLFLIDPDTWTMKPDLTVPGISAFALGRGGQLYFIQRSGETYLVVVDLNSRHVRERLLLPLRGRIYTRVGPAGRRLYVGTSAVLDGQLHAFDLRGQEADKVRPLGRAGRDRSRLLRGGLFLSPDGKLLFTGNGHAFHAPAGA
jgi:hypothetical protein